MNSYTAPPKQNIDWNEQLVRDVFENSDEHLHLSPSDKLDALSQVPHLTTDELIEVVSNPKIDDDYKSFLHSVATQSSGMAIQGGIKRYLVTVGHLKYGYTPAHRVSITLNNETFDVELPEVELWKNNVSYRTRMQDCDERDLSKTLYRCAMYTKRYAMNTGELVNIAVERGMNMNRALRITASAAKKCHLVKTIDVEALKFFEQAVEHCNSFKQVQILIELYREACTYSTMQPVFCKQRCSRKLGVDRKVIIRLFGRLEKQGLMMESPETLKAYDYAAGMPLSNPRIVNMDLRQAGRWWMLDQRPGPDRSIEKKTAKARKLAVLAGIGYWKENK